MTAIRRAHRTAVGMLCAPLMMMWPPATFASASAGFLVKVRHVTSQGVCTSGLLPGSVQTHFLVTCTSEQPVDMAPGESSVDAFRMRMVRGGSTSGGSASAGEPSPQQDAQDSPAVVTAAQVSPTAGSSGGPVEIVVSF